MDEIHDLARLPHEDVFDLVARARTLAHTVEAAGQTMAPSYLIRKVINAMGEDFTNLLDRLPAGQVATLELLPHLLQRRCDELHQAQNQREAQWGKQLVQQHKLNNPPKQLGGMVGYNPPRQLGGMVGSMARTPIIKTQQKFGQHYLQQPQWQRQNNQPRPYQQQQPYQQQPYQ